MINKMNGSVPQLLEKMLDYSAQKQKVISKNIANIGTYGYQREDVQFDEVMNSNSSIKTTSKKHIPILSSTPLSQYSVKKDNNDEMSSGFNNVDIEVEMAQLAENNIRFKLAARKLSGYYKNMQRVIKGGGGQ